MIHIEKDEKILLEVRKHWFILFAETLFLVVLALVPAGLAAIAQIVDLSSFVTFDGDGIYLAIIATAIWVLFLWTIFFIIWTDYYLDMLIVTDKRVIDIEQKGLFARNIATSQLEHIEDVTTEVHGIIATLLNFGTIHLQTAAESREFTMKGVPGPANIRRKIMNAHEEAMQRTFASRA